MQGTQTLSIHANLKNESVWFKTKLVSQFLILSFLLTQPFFLPYLHAAPVGGEVVGGTGTINQSDLTTTINQSTQNLAIDWQNFDVNTDEIVNFVQPNSSSIALNRILGNNGSTIQGQINANGQVILVNPHGIFFTSTATINVGGIIASSLNMTPSDFMNGNYIFNEVLGADGAVINSGIINASLGGNIALIGKQVKNEGLITANLGSVVLAAGKQSVLTFDNQGLIGVKVTKEVLQEDLGLEEAVINSGDINAAGGRVLLTASVSQDIFSQAVNNDSLNQAISVVVHEDGSFTLGGGADVLNTGSMDVSSESNSDNTARIILLGENITSSGVIKADVENGKAGEIEIHANNKTLLTENSITSAKALTSGQGGLIKILGDKVGLLDNSLVNASGVNSGGEVLIGGDQEGRNNNIRNSQFIYLSKQSQVYADATDNGNGGKVIAFAENSAKIHGQLFARGGMNGGDGGFIETSGLQGFQITSVPNASAFVGNNGTWLIDPFNITITDRTRRVDDDNGNFSFFDAIQSGAEIDVDDIVTGLGNGDVIIRTTLLSDTSDGTPESGDILFEADLIFDGIDRSSTLTLDADGDIDTNGFDIWDDDPGNNNDLLNIVFNADVDGFNGGNVILDDSRIYTNGGTFTATGQDFTSSRGTADGGVHYLDTRDKTNNTKGGDVNIYMLGDVDIGAEIFTGGGTVNIGDMRVAGSEIRPTSFINRNNGVIDTTGEDNVDGGDIIINVDNTVVADGTITVNKDLITNGGTAVKIQTSSSPDTFTGSVGRNAGKVTLNATGDIDITAKIVSKGTKGDFVNSDSITGKYGQDGGNGGNVNILSTNGNISISQEVSSIGGNGEGDKSTDNGADPASGGNAGTITIESSTGTLIVDMLTSKGGQGIGGDDYPNNPGVYANGGNAGGISLTGTEITLNNNIDASGGNLDNSNNVGHIGFGADVTFSGNVILGSGVSINSSGYTNFGSGTPVGNVWFKNTVTGLADTNQDLDISANDVIFDADIGTTTVHLGDITIAAAGDIKASTNSFYLKSFDVTSSNSFTSGLIDTSGLNLRVNGGSVTVNAATTMNILNIDSRGGLRVTGNGRNGGNIQLNASSISVSEINTSGGNATGTNNNGGSAGTITLTGIANNLNVSSITLNDDIIASGGENTTGGVLDGNFGTGQTASLILNGLATDEGNATINYTGSFTSAVNITGNTDNDTLTGAAVLTSNTWNITGTDDGNLNSINQITFNNVENLTGNSTQDDFIFNGGTLSGAIDGGANSSATVFNSITADTGNNIWIVDTNDDSGTASNLGGRFSNIGSLVGNTGRDDFTINGDVSLTGTIDGVGGSAGGTIALDDLKNSLTINSVSDNTWTISSSDTGSVSNGVAGEFSNIQKVKGGSGDDTFNVGDNGYLDLIEGGSDNSGAPTLTLGDIVNFTADTPANGVDVSLGTTLTISQTDMNIDSVEQINADSSATQNSITGKDQDNTWNITKVDGGDVEGTVNFNNFTNINGALNFDDTFSLGLNGSLQGFIDGRGQNTPSGDVLDLSQRENIILTINNATGHTLSFTGANINYKNIETIKGNNSGINQSKIVGENKASTWTIDGIDKGSVTEDGTSNKVLFEDFNFLTGGSLADKFILTGDGAISGVIDGGITSTGDNVSVDTPNNMVNLALGSTLVSNATNITNINRIDGDGVNTRITGENLTQTNWNITGQNIGNVNSSSGQVSFFNVHNLTGNSGKDIFTFDNQVVGVDSLASVVFLSGTIDGGATSVAGFDTVDMSTLIGTFTVKLGVDTNITGTTIVGVETIKGNNFSTLVGDLTARNDLSSTDWLIDSGINDGTVEFINAETENVSVRFLNFNSIQGQDNIDDVFTITGGKIGTIDGGGGNGIDSVDYSSSNETEVFVESASNGIGDIENVIGNSNVTLVGVQIDASNAAVLNTWVIENELSNNFTDGNNDGYVNFNLNDGVGLRKLSFEDFGGLRAGTLNDSFTVNSSGSFNGTITGGIGNNSLSVTLSGSQLGKLTFDGVSGINDITVMGDSDGSGGLDYVGEYTANINSTNLDEFKYTNSSDISKFFSIQYENTGTGMIQDNLLATSLTVNGTNGNDTIVLDADTFKVNAKPTVSYSGKTNFAVNGQGGTADTIRIDSNLDFAGGNLTLMVENLATQAAVTVFPTIRANELILNSVANNGTDINKKLNTDIAHLSVINSGSLFVEDVSGINIAELNNTDANFQLNIVASSGDITGFDRNVPTTNIDLISNGALTLNATSGSITLDGDNQLSGKLSFTTLNTENVRLNNATSTILDSVTTQDLIVTTTGTNSSISQFDNQSVIKSDGLTRLTSTGAINLANAANDFTRLAVISSPSVTIQDANTIGLELVNATLVDITAVDNITDANNALNNVNASSLTLRAGTGIGSSTNAIETSVSDINATTTSGGIYIDNVGDVKLTNLVVSNGGDITFINNLGNVELNKVDAGYDTGTFDLTVIGGSVTGISGKNYIANPDITAFNADIIVAGGTFGTIGRPIGVRIKNRFSLFSLQSAVDYSRSPPTLDIDDRSTAKISITDAFSNLAGQQLIEIESIGDIDPAIFTDVRNYNHSDLALMMPSDQRYDVSDEEEDEETKQKREKLLKPNH